MRIRALALCIVLVAGSSGASGGERVSYKDFLARNLANSARLSLGMSKAEVSAAMGDAETSTRDGPIYNPWTAEAFTKGSDTYEVLYFLVRKHPPFTPIAKNQAIAAVFKNGQLLAWGRGVEASYR